MNQQNRRQVGNLVVVRMLTANQVSYPDSEQDLTQILSTFNYTDILIVLARINLLLQSGEDFFMGENILGENFCSRFLRSEIDRKGFIEHIIFNRGSTLRLLSKSASISDSHSTRAPDTTVDARNDLARCYLIANGLLGTDLPNFGTDSTEEERKELLAALIPDLEYGINSSPRHHIRHSLVRSYEFLTCLQEAASTFDVNELFTQATGLNLRDYQYLILSILNMSLNFSPEEILEGDLFVNTQPSPALTPLYDRLLQHTCISIDELASEVETTPSLPNEFRSLRKYPLIKIDENQIMCIDIGFLLEKLETGVFWIIRNQLEEERGGRGEEIIQLWGQVFEDYAASIIERGINAQTPSSMERYIIRPKYAQRQQAECTDIAVCGNDTLILLECKAPLLSAQTKFSGNFLHLRKGLKNKIIEGKGIEQLWNAIQTLGHTNKKKRRKVEGIDISQIKKIYPVLVLPDRIFSIPLMNRFLDSEFQRFVKYNDLKDHLEIMPLTVLTIANLESLEPYFNDIPFHAHLDQWITQIFNDNKSYPFNEYLGFLKEMEGEMRQNSYMEQEAEQMHDDIKRYFAAQGIID